MGIEHALLPEQGVVVPGDLMIGADSHTCTYGGIGAFSTGVGSTDAGVGMATGRAWFKVPETIRFVIDGELPAGATAKDVILHHRHDRRGRRPVLRHGVWWLYGREPLGGGTPHHRQHGHRGGRQGRPIRGGRQVPRVGCQARPPRAARVPPGRRRHLQAGHPHRRGRHRPVRLLAAPAEQHPSRHREPPHRDRPGGHRKLHERPHRGHARGR